MSKTTISADGLLIEVKYNGLHGDYISLTDIAKYKTSENPGYVIQNWMRTRSTVRFLGLWEKFHNPDFNCLEFEAIEQEAGLNSFVLTPKRWIETINAIGMISKRGTQSHHHQFLPTDTILTYRTARTLTRNAPFFCHFSLARQRKVD